LSSAFAELLQDLADGLPQAGSEHGIIIASGYIDQFTEDWCGIGFMHKSFPAPRPHWLAHELDGVDQLVLATQFEQSAAEAFSFDLRGYLEKAAAKFTEVGMSRIQQAVDGVRKDPQ
jgi:hypothetical protein